MNDIYEGMTLDTHLFGNVSIWRLRCDGQHMYADCKTADGDSLFLSLVYIRRLMGI